MITAAAPFTGESSWSLGTLIWLPLLLVLVIGLVIAAVLARREGEAGLGWGVVAAAAALVVATALPVVGMYPYDVEYHKWHVVRGEVAQVDKRLIADGEGMSERYVVAVAGQSFGVDDTRAAALRAGATVTLSCKREWQYAAESGWACRWLGSTP